MSEEAKYKVGDVVWHATFSSKEKWIQCPECLGSKFATVIFQDGSHSDVDCANCSLGINPPTGLVKTWIHEPRAEARVIEGIAIRRSYDSLEYVVEYTLGNCHHDTEINVFSSEGEAQARALELAAEWHESEEKKLQKKDKPSKTWSQNASYHRRMLKKAEHDFEYHTKKLSVAKRHAKAEIVP